MVKRILAAGILVLAGFAQSAHAAVITVVPASPTVNVGSSVDVDIVVSLGANEAVGGVSLLLSFNDTLLGGSGFALDPGDLAHPLPTGHMGTNLNLAINDFGSGFVGGGSPLELFFIADFSLPDFASLNALQGGGFTLATVTLTGLVPGLSALNLAVIPSEGIFLSDALGAELPTEAVNGSICVADRAGNAEACAVPEPATMSLLGVGLGLLAVRRRRMQA